MWLARLDARARRSPRPVRWTYQTCRWYLIATGVVAAVGLAAEGNPLGIGLTAGIISALVTGTTSYLATRRA